MYCKNCGKKIEEFCKFCKFCGSNIDSFARENKQLLVYSNAIPLWKLFVFSIITMGLYSYYWYYRNWRYIRELEETDIKPGLRTLGLFVPILGWILIYQQYKYINQYVQSATGHYFSAGGMIAMHIVFNLIARVITAGTTSMESTSASFWYLLIIPMYLIPMVIVQYNFNLYWTATQPDLRIRHRLTIGEIIFIILIIVYMVLVFLIPFATTFLSYL